VATLHVRAQTPERGSDLAQGNATVVGRNALMPEWLEAAFGQHAHGPLDQSSVLKATPTQGDLLHAQSIRNGNH